MWLDGDGKFGFLGCVDGDAIDCAILLATLPGTGQRSAVNSITCIWKHTVALGVGSFSCHSARIS